MTLAVTATVTASLILTGSRQTNTKTPKCLIQFCNLKQCCPEFNQQQQRRYQTTKSNALCTHILFSNTFDFLSLSVRLLLVVTVVAVVEGVTGTSHHSCSLEHAQLFGLSQRASAFRVIRWLRSYGKKENVFSLREGIWAIYFGKLVDKSVTVIVPMTVAVAVTLVLKR